MKKMIVWILLATVLVSGCDKVENHVDRYDLVEGKDGKVYRLDKKTGKTFLIEGDKLTPLVAVQPKLANSPDEASLDDLKNWGDKQIPGKYLKFNLSTSWREGKLYYKFRVFPYSSLDRIFEEKRMDSNYAKQYQGFTINLLDKNSFKIKEIEIDLWGMMSEVDGEGEKTALSVGTSFDFSKNDYEAMEGYSIGWVLAEVFIPEKEPNLNKVKATVEILTVDDKTFVKMLNQAYESLIRAYELSFYGLERTGEPHLEKFVPHKYRIDASLYIARDIMKSNYDDLNKVVSSDDSLSKIKDKLISAIREGLLASEDLILALENKTRQGYPLWEKARAARIKMRTASEKNSMDTLYLLIDKIREISPEMEDDILFISRFRYKNKDKSKWEIIEENKKMGHIDVDIWSCIESPVTVLKVHDGGPAKKAGIKTGDIIMGVEGEPDFVFIKDYIDFQHKTHSGDKYKFKFERNGNVFKKTIKMN